jgi:hypothetical protein
VTDTRRSEEQANLPAVASLRSRAPLASLTWPRWSRAEALLAVLELELGPAAADLRGHDGVELVDGGDDGVRAVVWRRLPLIHVLFLLQQRSSP